jgi:hypothetical protein
MSYENPNFDTVAFFPIDREGRYQMTLGIMKSDASCMVPISCMIPVEMASDSGADMILVTRRVADSLKYHVDNLSQDYNFMVQGKSGEPTVFKEIQTWIQIGNMKPLQAPIGLAVNEDSLLENLFGNQGTIDSGYVAATYNNKGVTYVDLMHSGRMAVAR